MSNKMTLFIGTVVGVVANMLKVQGRVLPKNFFVVSSKNRKRCAKDVKVKIGEQVKISVPNKICHLFDRQTGAKIVI